MTRDRSRQTYADGGAWSRYRNPPILNPSLYIEERERTLDENILPGDGYPFDTDLITLKGGVINRRFDIPDFPVMENWVCDAVRTGNSTLYSHNFTGAPTTAQIATKVLARSNPSRPYVDIAVFLAELRDLPLLFKSYGDSLLKGAARGNLAYEFGIKPFVSDLFRLLSLQQAIDARFREVNKIMRGAYSRRISVGTYSATSSPTVVLNSQGSVYLTGTINKVTTEDCSGFVRWYSTDEQLRNLGTTELMSLIRRAVLGMTVDFSTAWELLPFSWLADWVANVGDILSSRRNILNMTPSSVQVMRHTVTRGTSSPKVYNYYTQNDVSISALDCKRENKSRTPHSGSLSANLPILTGRQTSILGSIGLSRYRGNLV